MNATSRSTRSSSTASKKATVRGTPEFQPETTSAWAHLRAGMDEIFDTAGMPNISTPRLLCVMVLSIVAMCGVWFMAGPVLTMIAVSTLAATGSAFLGFLAMVLGFITTWWVASKIGSITFCLGVVASPLVDIAYAKSKNFMLGLVGRASVELHA